MSKLEKLIQQYCPDGVEYKALGEVTIMKRGTSATKGIMQAGNIPVISGGRQPAFYCNASNRTGEVITVAGSGAGAGYVQYWNEPIFVCDAFSIQGNETLNTKYVYYVLTSIQEKIYSTKKGGGVPHVHISSIDKFEIPVPPLPVQEEIVRILDAFTELQAELQAELQKRKQQYNHYLDNLLNFKNINRGGQEIKWMRMSEIGNNLDKKRKPITAGKREPGQIPYYGASGIVDYVKDYLFDGDYLLVSEDGANLLTRTYPIAFSIHGKTWVNNHAHVIEFKERATRKYVEYYLNSIDLSPWISAGAQPKLTQDSLNKLTIPVPPLAEQQRIVFILDRFDTLTNDLTSGLPAEMEKRRQQYEFYRDKLLTFKRKEA